MIPELDFKTRFNTTVFPDGTIKNAIRLEHGWWESKAEYDRLDDEEEFKNICLVDTLDHCSTEGHQFDLFAMSVQNTARIQQQNEKIISVIIGNPPYNAHQENFNQRNSNRPYQGIDQAIKDTYIKEGTAQNQIVVYDMYTRFFRWASDRLGNNGLIAFVTNRSFIDSKTFNGFRKCIDREFNYVYIIDTQSDVRNNPKISGTKNNVFGIQTGIAVMFLVKQSKEKKQ